MLSFHAIRLLAGDLTLGCAALLFLLLTLAVVNAWLVEPIRARRARQRALDAYLATVPRRWTPSDEQRLRVVEQFFGTERERERLRERGGAA